MLRQQHKPDEKTFIGSRVGQVKLLGNARREPWEIWHSWHRGICNLLIPGPIRGFESHPHREVSPLLTKDLGSTPNTGEAPSNGAQHERTTANSYQDLLQGGV